MRRKYIFLIFLSIIQSLYATEHATIGIYAVHCNTGAVLMDTQSDLALIPASCMKIVTTATALQLIGPEVYFETHLEYDGWINEHKTLIGNIYIRGGGDPCLGSDRITGSAGWKKQIEIWADAVQKLGITKIKGTVQADTSKWENAMAIPSWLWEDIGNYYGVGANALSFHENAYSLIFAPSSVGEKAKILCTEPPIPILHFQNEVYTGPEGSGDQTCIYGSELSSNLLVRGTIPAGVPTFSIKGAIHKPGALCTLLLSQELERRGITIEQKKIAASEKNLLHTTYSPSIAEIVYWTNQKSINIYAEHLLKKIGEVMQSEGSTQAGIQAVTDFWKDHGIDLDGFHMADGSGLSRKNLITAKQLVSMLVKIRNLPHFPEFFASLPAQGNINAKTGTMSLIKGYAGYCDDIAFAIFINQCTDPNHIAEKMAQILTSLQHFDQTP